MRPRWGPASALYEEQEKSVIKRYVWLFAQKEVKFGHD